MDKAFALLDEQEFEKAFALGRRLLRLGHTGGYEIAALALLRQDKPLEARRVLRWGLRENPQISILWKVMGDACSDLERYDEAEEAYQRALQTNVPDVGLVHLNRAIAFIRREKWTAAEDALLQIQTPRLLRMAKSHLVETAVGAGQSELALERAMEILNSERPTESPEDQEGPILIRCVQALLSNPAHHAYARRVVIHTIIDLNAPTSAFWALRQLDPLPRNGAPYFRLFVEGRRPPDDENPALGFYRHIDVVVPDAEAALEEARRIFPANVRDSIRTLEVKELETDVRSQGLYWASRYFFFNPDAE